MDIGTKIKHARIAANLTQEQAAEALGVSRQTISNWENEKTYPDVVNVIKMSDLYEISLDHLLKGKGEASVSDYVDYLEESTNVVKSKNKLAQTMLIVTFLGIWAFSLLVFWCFTSGADAMGYWILVLWILLPMTILVTSLLIGKRDYWGKWKWLSPVVFGIMYMLAHYATFSTANMITANKINMPDFGMIVSGAAVSLIGVGAGTAIRCIRTALKRSR